MAREVLEISSVTWSNGSPIAISFAASNKLGPITANSPPPEGIAKLTTPPIRKLM